MTTLHPQHPWVLKPLQPSRGTYFGMLPYGSKCPRAGNHSEYEIWVLKRQYWGTWTFWVIQAPDVASRTTNLLSFLAALQSVINDLLRLRLKTIGTV